MFAAGRQCYWMRVRRCHQCPVPGPRPTQLWNDKPGPGHCLRPVCGDIMTHQILLHLQPNLEGNKVFCSFNRGQAFGIVHCIVFYSVNVLHYILTSIPSQSICIMYDDGMILQSRNWPPSWEHTLCMCDDDYCFCVPNWLPDLGTASALAAVRAGTVDTRASNEGPHRGS